MAPLLSLRGVSRVYGTGTGQVRALDDIDLDIEAGDFVALMGPSGSGKSTCLNVLGCLDEPTAGSYRFRGVEVTELDTDRRALLRRHFLGFVFQGYNLLARTSALENVELPLVYRGYGAARRHELAARALDEVGLLDWAHHTPAELSGGQQQRVSIARALVSEPSVLLADEPTGNLDSKRSHDILALLDRVHRARGVTIVMVTHEREMAAYAHRTLQFRDGRLLAREAA